MSDNAFTPTGQTYGILATGNAAIALSITAATTCNTYWCSNTGNATVFVSIVQPGGNTAIAAPTNSTPAGGLSFPPAFTSTMGGPVCGPQASNCTVVVICSAGSNVFSQFYITPGEGL